MGYHRIVMGSVLDKSLIPGQDVWQIIPVNNQLNIFYIRNKLYSNDLFATPFVNSKDLLTRNR